MIGEDVEAAKFAVPPNEAVMVWVPTVNEVVLNPAVPKKSGKTAIGVLLSRKVTDPPLSCPPDDEINALKLTRLPKTAGVSVVETVVEVDAGFTVMLAGAEELGGCEASPV